MTEEEINEAIKLIKEPIIVNSVEYKYFSQENYEKLLRVYENCRRFIDNYEQVLQNIEILQQELQRKDNIINGIKKELNKNYNTYVCKNKSYGKTFKSGAEVYKEHLLYKLNELEGENK